MLLRNYGAELSDSISHIVFENKPPRTLCPFSIYHPILEGYASLDGITRTPTSALFFSFSLSDHLVVNWLMLPLSSFVAIPLALNFIASEIREDKDSAAFAAASLRALIAALGGNLTIHLRKIMASISDSLGSGILFTYPEIATIAGVQGLVIYGLASALPLLVFGYLGPIIRKKCPEGFVLTEWARERYGLVTAIYLSILTLITLFLYMVAELSALQQIVSALTGLNGLPTVIVQVMVTTIYTSLGGFKVSFITDNIQGAMVVGLVIIAVITVGTKTNIDRSLIDSSGLLDASLLGWQLIYILPIAIFTNDFFLSNFWLRTFASKSDRDLRIGVSIASGTVFCILTLVGVTGLLAAWSGAWPGNPPQRASIAFFLLLEKLPGWVVGIVLVMTVSLSTAAFDSLQSAMVSTGSNDLFRNRLPLKYVRILVVLCIIPVVVVALRSPSVLQIFLISDLVSASSIPVLTFGLWEKAYWWKGFEVVVGGLGGIFSVFVFGAIYFKDAQEGAKLILLGNGLYAQDWSVFGAFLAAPLGGILFGIAALGLRLGYQFLLCKHQHRRFDALDKPEPRLQPSGDGISDYGTAPIESGIEGLPSTLQFAAKQDTEANIARGNAKASL
ncbi:urea transport protein [Paracoccidioides lutzii Pb01]|uniref:Urea transport protein n=1 Tax=Paracoccidioides lutzii (strain ATCC MYA-826 / Pb01) TaxID=502779 RepID=C1H547_PARBA|nr:urea transport protein [Paracoccidioides lutzii Pb01]EEH34841.2 urea transport protein [Paracoccidioides lutzii Pb01]